MSTKNEKAETIPDREPNECRKEQPENKSSSKDTIAKPILKKENAVGENGTGYSRITKKDTSGYESKTGHNKCLNEMEKQLVDGVATFWKSKAFSDIEIHCGVDGGIVLAHRILLATISPFLKVSMQSLTASDTENTILLIPDVSSENITEFLDMVCSGSTEPAVIREELQYLGFCHDSYLKQKVYQNDKVNTDSSRNVPKLAGERKIIGDQQPYVDYGVFETDCASNHISSPTSIRDISAKSEEDGTAADIKLSQTNLLWNYFIAKDKRHAICKTCSAELKIGIRNYSSLSRHLRNSHPKFYREFIIGKRAFVSHRTSSLKQGECIDGSTEESNVLSGGSNKSSLVWNYFTSLPNDRTKCNSCNQEMRTFDGSTSGMLRHLRRNHEHLYKEWKVKKEEHQHNTILAKSFHPIWSYFEATKESKSYKCLICNSMMELPDMQMVLLEEHLKIDHEEAFKEFNNKLKDENLQHNFKDLTKGRTGVGGFHGKFSRVWKLYEQIGQDQAKCNECGTILRVFSNSTSGLLRHIKRHHEYLYKEFNKSEGKQFNIDPNNISNDNHPIWEWFSKKEEQNGTSNCKECKKKMDPADLPSLTHHLKEFHPEKHVSYDISLKHFMDTLTIPSSLTNSKKTGIRSAIWKYFKRTENRNLNDCSICGINVRCNKMDTSNMIRHLERYHLNEYESFLKENSNNVIFVEKQLCPFQKTGTEVKKKRGPKPKTKETDPADRTCPDCGKSFSGRAAMRFHKRVVHSGIRPFKCEECGMTFARGDSFKGHTHSKTRSFLCTICGKTFGRKNIRDQHERAHRGDRRYNCNYCNRKFMTNQQRMNHERVHTGEKPYQVLKLFDTMRKISAYEY